MEKKKPHTHTFWDTHNQGTKKEGRPKSTKNKIQINVLPLQLPILFPCTLPSALCQCHCLSTVSHSLFILPPLFIHLFFPLPLFYNPDEKNGGERSEDIPRGQTSAGRGDAVGWRGMEREERDRHRGRENMIWCSIAMPTDKILVLCKRGLRATPNKGVRMEAALKSLSFVGCQSSMQTRTHALCTESELAYSHTSAASAKRRAY